MYEHMLVCQEFYKNVVCTEAVIYEHVEGLCLLCTFKIIISQLLEIGFKSEK